MSDPEEIISARSVVDDDASGAADGHAHGHRTSDPGSSRPPLGFYQDRVFSEDMENARAFRSRQTKPAKRQWSAGIAPDDFDESVDDDENQPAPQGTFHPKGVTIPLADHSAVRMLLARLMDTNPEAVAAMLGRSPFVCIDVPDSIAFGLVQKKWRAVLLPPHWKVAHFDSSSLLATRMGYDAIAMVVGEQVKPRDAVARDCNATAAYQCALPIIAVTPDARSYLSPLICEAIEYQLELPGLDDDVIRRSIEIVTGTSYDLAIEPAVVSATGLHQLALAVRIDRTAAECVAVLAKLAAAKAAKKDSRDISLDQLHGMDEAVAWAKSSIRDLKAWKAGEIGWDAVDSGVCLVGPPGTGKTSFAGIFASAANVPIVCATLGKWQGTGDAHLGHLLRAMHADFELARSKAPCVMFIDELDAFPDRESVTHSHRDYVVEVVNSFLAELDGLAGRKGVIFVGATNSVQRCDPAILRSGRIGKVIRIERPSAADLEKMYRVRLRGDLAASDLSEVCLISLGRTGADVERVVNDARRSARHASRALVLSDLLDAARGPVADLSAEMLRRAAIHEAGHIVMEVLYDGPEGVHARLGVSRTSAGVVVRENAVEKSGTYADYQQELHIALAGRAAEEVVGLPPGHGAGGTRESDLAVATRTVCAMIGSVGLSGPHPLVFLGPRNGIDDILDSAYLRSAVQDELRKAADGVKAILTKHRAALEKVARHLLEHRRIDGPHVSDILRNGTAPANAEASDVTRPSDELAKEPSR